MKMKKFLRYKVELEGTNENDITDEFVKKLESDFENKRGIYNTLFGEPCEVAAHAKHDTVVLCGCIIASTVKECKQIYGALKVEAKNTFKNCRKASDLIVATGNKLF
jgi:hypothetical protein